MALHVVSLDSYVREITQKSLICTIPNRLRQEPYGSWLRTLLNQKQISVKLMCSQNS